MHKSIYQTKTIYNFVKKVFPQVKKELHFWKKQATKIPNEVLSYQAISSIQKKTFHAQGGCIYSLYYGHVNKELLRFIVALQTISDYLDNLCDRVGVENEKSFLQLHHAITDSLQPNPIFHNYYKDYPYKDDGNYLYLLVKTCKDYLKTLPNFHLVQKDLLFLGKLYSEMQSYKHIAKNKREQAMDDWANNYLHLYKNLSTWEFSAAAGSTLGMFLLCALSTDKNSDEKTVKNVMDAYFPYICGLHILLDYFIDEREDLATGDLNFVSYYKDDITKEKRLLYFLQQSLNKALSLQNPLFHITVIEGLLSMYLSDPKTNFEAERNISKKILRNTSFNTNILHASCKLLRRKNILG
ncbi:tetraprenyl-beta-curcumene synthase family protein [Crassaminicella profunda]|uniref:tetraprenyl-beta-curcumene synthase family protein n=1 Tax=Crassaminicella profunda TaxID=1286698 RepID=UPI001CA735F1|nr:tetraprenyl-beta-curcumene synthase family protein [Crassaminicella profunda]QZY55034.1 tetraprenyl-beta-curcumene synthase family protein [Crassaminicella profunda]